MATEEINRKLAAILSAGVEDYIRFIGEDRIGEEE